MCLFPFRKGVHVIFFSFFQGSARISSVSLDLCWCLTVPREERESKGNSCVFSIILLGAAVTEVILVWVLASGPIFIPVLQCRLRCLNCYQGYLLVMTAKLVLYICVYICICIYIQYLYTVYTYMCLYMCVCVCLQFYFHWKQSLDSTQLCCQNTLRSGKRFGVMRPEEMDCKGKPLVMWYLPTLL